MSDVEYAKFAAGTVIAERYRLEREIGRGGMGTVWRALHLALQGPVAIKLINRELLDSGEARSRFLREARSAAALRSTHVVQILDHGVHDETPYIVMELLEGESLAERLQRQTVLSIQETLKVMDPVGRALSLAHERGIVHRDLKPDNIFIAREGELEVVKVLDFGIAKDSSAELRASLQTQEGAILGTPHYLSPEQAQGSTSVDHRADLWSLAVIVCECVTGRRPFETKHMGDLIVRICSRPPPVPSTLAEVPEGFDQWFAKALSHQPDQRFQSSGSMITSLECLTTGAGSTDVDAASAHATEATLPTLVDPASPLRASRVEPRPNRERRRWSRPTTVLAALALTLGFGFWALSHEAPKTAVAPPPRVSRTAFPVSEVGTETPKPEAQSGAAAANSSRTASDAPRRSVTGGRRALILSDGKSAPATGSALKPKSKPKPKPFSSNRRKPGPDIASPDSSARPSATALPSPIPSAEEQRAESDRTRVDFGF